MVLTWIILGLVVGLFGWMLYWAGLPIIGAMIGAGMGAGLGYFGSALFPGSAMAVAFLTGAGLVLGAIIGAFMIKALAIYFFFIAGTSLGGALAWNLLGGAAADTTGGGWIFVAIAAVLGGVLMVWLRRFVVAVVTAIFGAAIFAQGLPPQYYAIGLVVSLITFMAIQIGLVNRFIDREQFDERTRRRLREDRPDVETVD